MHSKQWLAETWSDLVYGTRSLGREPVFTAFAVSMLALGLGANAAMFGIIDRLMISGPAHVRDAHDLRRLQVVLRSGAEVERSGAFGYVTYDALRRNAQSFSGIAAYNAEPQPTTILGRGSAARRIIAAEATASLFPVLGANPAIGRFYTEREDDPATPERVVVLGYGLWQQEYGGRPDVLGQRITLDTREYTIVGVAPRGFTGADLTRVDVWIPTSALARQSRAANWTTTWYSSWLSIIVRTKPGVADRQADAEATALVRGAYVGTDTAKAQATIAVRPLRFTRNGDEAVESRVSKWLVAVAVVLLLITCANVVNLLLARALRRRREMAVRLTLGAGRWRLVRLLVIEAVALALAGCVAGLVVAYAIGTVMRVRLFPHIEWTSPLLDVRVIALSTIVALMGGLVVGLVPALQASAPDLTTWLKSGVREGGGRMGRTRTALTTVQAALSVVLLVGAGLFIRSLQQVRALDLGLDTDRVLTFTVQRTGLGLIADTVERSRERVRRMEFYRTAVEAIGRRPDVEHASLTIGLPFSQAFGQRIRVPGRDSIPEFSGGGPYVNAVSSAYFKTMGTRLLLGREFSNADRGGTQPVAIINETMAAALWPGDEALGKCFMIRDTQECTTVVGVAVNARRFQLREDRAMAFYVPFGQEQGIAGTQLLIRPRGDAPRLVEEVRRTLMTMDPGIVFVGARALQDGVETQVRPWRLGAAMFGLMGTLALLVAALGLYGVMSYYATLRRHELGVRIALGATFGSVVGLIVRSGIALAIGGVAIGLGVSLLAGVFIEPLLFNTSSRDPFVLGVVALTLLTSAALACIVPAVRAARLSPIQAMRID